MYPDLTGRRLSLLKRPRQVGTLISVFVILIFYLQPTLAFAVIATAETRPTLNIIFVSIDDDAYAESSVVAASTASDKGNEIDPIRGNRESVHSAGNRDRLFNRIVAMEFDAGRNHALGSPKDARFYESHGSVRIASIDVPEVNLTRLVISGQFNVHAVDNDFRPVSGDELSVAKFGSFFSGANGALQLNPCQVKTMVCMNPMAARIPVRMTSAKS